MVIRLPGDYERAMAEAVARSRREAEEYAKDRAGPHIDLDKCDLCGRKDQELTNYGAPLGYVACVDVDDCEEKRSD